MQFQIREEVLNVVLADLLSSRGLISVPEAIRGIVRPDGSRNRRLPDVTTADLQGVRVVIEGRIDSSPAVRGSLFKHAKARVEDGVSPICLAVLYSPSLRHITSLQDLRVQLAMTTFRVRVVSEAEEGSWMDADLDAIAGILLRSYEALVREDVVATSVEELNSAIDATSGLFIARRGTPARIRALLGIPGESAPRKSHTAGTE